MNASGFVSAHAVTITVAAFCLALLRSRRIVRDNSRAMAAPHSLVHDCDHRAGADVAALLATLTL
jgi:hypothetical protein